MPLNRPVRRPLSFVYIFLLGIVATLFLFYNVQNFTPPNVPAFVSNFKILFTAHASGADLKLAWILHFNYEPHPEVVKILLHFYAKHFVFIAIVCPTGRSEKLLHVDTSTVDAEVVWAPACPNYLRNAVAGLMMICYSKGLQLLQASSKVNQVNFVVLSNDDVVLNMTKVREFTHEGRPVSHMSLPKTKPPMFEPPKPNETYFEGWSWARWWPECQKLFAKVPQEFKNRYLERYGDRAMKGPVDVFLLPSKSVPEFLFLTSIVGKCWIEMNIPNALAMLTEPPKFNSSDTEMLMYHWPNYGDVVTPEEFEEAIKGKTIMSFHPFKLSYPEHRKAFAHFMTKYKFNQYY